MSSKFFCNPNPSLGSDDINVEAKEKEFDIITKVSHLDKEEEKFNTKVDIEENFDEEKDELDGVENFDRITGSTKLDENLNDEISIQEEHMSIKEISLIDEDENNTSTVEEDKISGKFSK